VIREVVASTGNIQTVVGNGTAGFIDNVAPLSAELDDPYAVAVDISGNIFIADNANDVIRVVNTGTTAITFGPISVPAKTILTVAGTPQLDCGEDRHLRHVAMAMSPTLRILSICHPPPVSSSTPTTTSSSPTL
jgi:hypothetical protein